MAISGSLLEGVVMIANINTRRPSRQTDNAPNHIKRCNLFQEFTSYWAKGTEDADWMAWQRFL